MRYLFRGIIRDTGGPVEGHVEAANEEDGYSALSENGVVTESLIPDPKPLNLNEELPASPEFADALESAFDSSSSQVDFDALSERYHGKKVWVIDRDKIRRRVAQVVDAALALSAQHGEGAGKARERVASAIQGLFNDTRNLATERNADSIAGMRFNAGAGAASDSVAGLRFTTSPQPPKPTGFAPGNGGGAGYPVPPTGHPGLEHQIGRLASLVKQAEATLAAVAAAARRGGGGGGDGGGRRRSIVAAGRSEEQNSVLLEIFKSNLALVRGMQGTEEGAAAAGGGAPAGGAPAGAAPAMQAAPASASVPMNVAESAPSMSSEPPAPPVPQNLTGPVTDHLELDSQSTPMDFHDSGGNQSSSLPMAELLPEHPESQ